MSINFRDPQTNEQTNDSFWHSGLTMTPPNLATIFFSSMCLRYTCLMFYVCFVVFCVFCLFLFLLHARVLVGTRALCLLFIIITIPRSLHLSEYECLTGFWQRFQNSGYIPFLGRDSATRNCAPPSRAVRRFAVTLTPLPFLFLHPCPSLPLTWFSITNPRS